MGQGSCGARANTLPSVQAAPGGHPGLGLRGQQAAGGGGLCLPCGFSQTVGPSKELGAHPLPPTQHLTRGQGRGRTDGQTALGEPGGQAGPCLPQASRPGLQSPGSPCATQPNHAAASLHLLNEPERPPGAPHLTGAASTQPPCTGTEGREGGTQVSPAPTPKPCTRHHRSSRWELGWQVPVASPTCVLRPLGVLGTHRPAGHDHSVRVRPSSAHHSCTHITGVSTAGSCPKGPESEATPWPPTRGQHPQTHDTVQLGGSRHSSLPGPPANLTAGSSLPTVPTGPPGRTTQLQTP